MPYMYELPKGKKCLLLDGDILIWRAACNSEVTTLEEADQKLFELIHSYFEGHGLNPAVDYAFFYYTKRNSENYRKKVYIHYKQTREDKEVPEFVQKLYSLIEQGVAAIFSGDSQLDSVVYSDKGGEADDAIRTHALALLKDGHVPIIVSSDKDLRMSEGYHPLPSGGYAYIAPDTFKEVHEEKAYGLYCFFHQMLEGDRVDNITGIPKSYVDGVYCSIGKVRATKLLKNCTTCGEAWDVVCKTYQDGKDSVPPLLSYDLRQPSTDRQITWWWPSWYEWLRLNGQLLWISNLGEGEEEVFSYMQKWSKEVDDAA